MSQPPRFDRQHMDYTQGGSPPDRQREHQANERTFLAWVRTSIALISFGLAIARFGLFLRELQQGMTQNVFPPHPVSSQTIGLVLVLAGMVMIVLAAWSYNQAYRQIERGNYHPNRWIIWATTLVMLIIGGLSLPFVLWQPSRTEGTGQTRSQTVKPRRGMAVRQSPFSIRLVKQDYLSNPQFSRNRRMKVHRHRSLGKRQTVA